MFICFPHNSYVKLSESEGNSWPTQFPILPGYLGPPDVSVSPVSNVACATGAPRAEAVAAWTGHLVNVCKKTMEHHHCNGKTWENMRKLWKIIILMGKLWKDPPLFRGKLKNFQGPCSIAMLNIV